MHCDTPPNNLVKVMGQVRGSNFFKTEIFLDHKLYDLGYVLLEKKNNYKSFFIAELLQIFLFA